METLNESQRETALSKLRSQFLAAIPAVEGGVKIVLKKPEVAETWSWVLLRASRDITENNGLALISNLSAPGAIANLVGRAGARAALPLAYDSELGKPVPTVEFWRSHVTGLPLPNPWAPGSENLTDQAFVRAQLGESFAQELEIAARGGRTYREEFERREEERLGKLAAAYDGPNPFDAAAPAEDFSADGMSAQLARSMAIKRISDENPILARWLQTLAKSAFANPFEPAPAWNLTRQGMVLKADPEFAALLQRTAEWRGFQLAAEAKAADDAARAAKFRAVQAQARAR